MLKKLWKDEAGIVALEYLVLATIVGLGLIVAAVAVRNSLVAEFTELGNAITALSQEYSYSGISWMGCASTEGSQATDSPDFNTTDTTAGTASTVDVEACP
jgi:Flp pilus assembly pilin Flp